MLQRGTTLNGKYRLVEKLGEGGMGSVWLAENVDLGAEVAIKVLHTVYAQDAAAVTRFRHEAQAAAKIGHPNIVRVFDFGEAEDRSHFMVMERLKGESLAERLERVERLAPREAVEVMVPVLQALDAAHRLDILHRDLKPENVFLSQEGAAVVPKILDFGVSKYLGDDADRVRMTRTGSLVGTPAYMSPEQARGQDDVDRRSDLWALGVMLYELLTGVLPYDANNYNAMLIAIATQNPPSILTRMPDLDPALAAVVDRSLAHDRDERVSSAREVLDALQSWLRGGPVSLTPPRPSAPQRVSFSSSSSRATPVTFESADTLVSLTPAQPSRARYAVAGAGALLLVVALAVGLTRRPAESTPAPTPVAVQRTLVVAGIPTGATVLIDEQPSPLPARVNEGEHRVEVRMAGFLPWVTQLPAGREPLSTQWVGTPEPVERRPAEPTPDAGARPVHLAAHPAHAANDPVAPPAHEPDRPSRPHRNQSLVVDDPYATPSRHQ